MHPPLMVSVVALVLSFYLVNVLVCSQQNHAVGAFVLSSTRPRIHQQRANNAFAGVERNGVTLLARQHIKATASSSSCQRLADILSIVAREFLRPIVLSYIFPHPNSNNATTTTTSTSTSSSTTTTLQSTTAQALTSTLAALGPTYIKFGQALSARSDLLPEEICHSLAALQSDIMDTKLMMDLDTARSIVRKEWQHVNNTLRVDVDSFACVAAASIGQVYSAYPLVATRNNASSSSWSQQQKQPMFAIKVQRPDAATTVAQDEALLSTLARTLNPLVPTDLEAAVHEFMQRLREELDYGREVNNLLAFQQMYGPDGTAPIRNLVIPRVYPEYCTEKVIMMEWIQGTPLTNTTTTTLSSNNDDTTMADAQERTENLQLLKVARIATLTQLFETGLMHADPHGGNLRKVVVPGVDQKGNKKRRNNKNIRLAYLDFGMVSTIDATIRDALMCAVIEIVVCRDVQAMVDLFGELQIIKPRVLSEQRDELVLAMTDILDQVFEYPSADEHDKTTTTTAVPQLRFDTLLGGLVLLIAKFQFELPPYFINNARALATLEGLTRQLDPSHNTMTAIYPFCLNRLFRNPTRSPIVERTLWKALRDPVTGKFSRARQQQLLQDVSLLTGVSRRRVVWDIARTRGGRKVMREMLQKQQRQWRGRRQRKR